MPIYEYACRSCGQHLEVAQSFKDDPLTECPACGGSLRKVYGTIGITFKGSGFYRTDSRKASASGTKSDTREKAGADKAAKADAGAKSDASSSGDGASGGKETSGSKAAKAAKSDKPAKPKAASA